MHEEPISFIELTLRAATEYADTRICRVLKELILYNQLALGYNETFAGLRTF